MPQPHHSQFGILLGKITFLKCALLPTLLLLNLTISSGADSNNSSPTTTPDEFLHTNQSILPPSLLKANHFNHLGNRLPRCACGLKGSQTVKIVGGVLSKKHCWPWVAAIVRLTPNGRGKKVVCGSSLLSKRHLLTAAHCVDYIQRHGLSNFRVILGTNDLNDKDAIVLNISSAISHPRFDSTSLDYDVGIVELESPVQFSRSISPICLTPQKAVPYVKKSAIVAGWGSTYFGGATTTMQMQVMLGVLSNLDCQARYRNETTITNRMMCARRSNKDSCQGDSGGPLFRLQEGSKDRYLQIGIVSFGKGCGDKRYPGIYGRVSRFTNWIRRRVGNENGCSNI